MIKIQIDGLFVLVGTDDDGNPTVYDRVFIDKHEAKRLSKELNMQIKEVFINNLIINSNN